MDENEALLRALTGGEGKVRLLSCTDPPVDRVARKLPKALAIVQNMEGAPVWFPPEAKDTCVEYILHVCGLGAEKRKQVASQPEMQRLRVDQLPRLTVELLMSLFGLSLSEAIDFQQTAKWIDVKRDVSLRLLQEANQDAWHEMLV
jgi:predicted DNA-binding helix-hairpin-helix protein